MNKEEMKKRTKQFGLRAIRLCEALPDTPLYQEADDLISIVVSSIKTAKGSRK